MRPHLLLLSIRHSPLLVQLICLLSDLSQKSLYVCILLPEFNLLQSQFGFQIFYLSRMDRRSSPLHSLCACMRTGKAGGGDVTLFDLRGCGQELLQAVLEPLHLLGQLGVFFPQQVAVQLHKLQETLWGGVVEVFLILLVLDTHLLHVIIQSLGMLSPMELVINAKHNHVPHSRWCEQRR